MVPTGIVVAVAIMCVVVAVLGSARRADEFAFAQEQQLLTRAFANRSDWILRRLATVAADDLVAHSDSQDSWLEDRVSQWSKTLMDVDFVVVANPADQLAQAWVDGRSAIVWTDATIPEFASVLDYIRGRTNTLAGGIVELSERPKTRGRPDHVALLQTVNGRSAIVVAKAVAPASPALAGDVDNRSILLGASFVSDEMMAKFSVWLQLPSLRQVDPAGVATTDHTLDFVDRSEERRVGQQAAQ